MPRARRRTRGPNGLGSITARRRKDGVTVYRWVPPPDDTGRRLGAVTCATRAEAEQARDATLRPTPAGAEQTLGDYLESWLGRQTSQAPQTRISLGNALRHWEPISHVLLGELTEDDVRDALPLLATRLPGRRYGRPLAPGTAQRALHVLRQALAPLVPRVLASNPAARVRLPTRQRREPPAWTEAEVARLLDAATGSEWEPFFRLALATGLRVGELLALQRTDLDLDGGLVWARHNRVQHTGAIGPTKGRQLRRVPLPPVVVAALRRHLASHSSVWLFPRSDGASPIPDGRCALALARLTAEAGIRPYTLHSTRHTYATSMLRAGVPVATVSKLLGHSSPGVTLNTYWAAVPEDDTLAAQVAQRLQVRESGTIAPDLHPLAGSLSGQGRSS